MAPNAVRVLLSAGDEAMMLHVCRVKGEVM